MGFNYTVDVYERFKGRKDLLSPTQMSVLLALAYTANHKTGECFPGKGHLQALTLLGESAVDEACRQLKKKGVVDIKARRVSERYNRSNQYSFLLSNWPKRPSYESISVDNFDDDVSHGDVTSDALPHDATHLPREKTEAPSSGDREIPRYVTPNQEQSTQTLPLKYPGGVGDEGVQFADIPYQLNRASENGDFVEKAIRACGIRSADENSRKNFAKVVSYYGRDNARETLEQFVSEVKAGEHRDEANKVKLLMSRMKKTIKPDHPFKAHLEDLIEREYGV